MQITKRTPPLLSPVLAGLTTIVLTLFLLTVSASGAREMLELYVGEVKVLKTKRVERVAIGNPKVASNTILPNGQLILMGDAVGATTMHLWLADGEREFDVVVRDRTQLDDFQELTVLLKEIEGVSTIRVGDLTVIKGEVAPEDSKQLATIIDRFKDVLNLSTAGNHVTDIKTLLATIPGTTISEVGGHTVISGEVSEEYEKLIKIVQEKYPDLMNLTRTHAAVAGKMIYMKVRIMEMKKSVQERIGIKWGDLSLQGPSFEFGLETSHNGATLLNSEATSQVLKKAGGSTLNSASGYFGIATGITSVINLLEANGDTVILAEPSLSTRSGGKASFLAGGEIPMPIISSLGQTTVEFKQYGISLDIEPVVDDRNNILAHIETEVSTPDQSVAVAGIPGLLSRKTSTDISMRAGDTLIIAGLLNEQAQKSYDNVKWLSELPILGPLFRSKDYLNESSELVIFVTPRIYDASAQLNVDSLETADKIERQYQTVIGGDGLLD